ncbi:nuclear transport factor 2 family protein [Promicromonospora panici]|uniref:nuclear transport factor 2 family protein n=1 Tax=Promicromonospora panici TaxID=2219658 RepID=UPI00101D5E6D|nr:nuclear transport factor 2 family protein [Promicromonospora panici]
MGNREIVAAAFDDWADGNAHVSRIFAEDMTWEITGRSAAAGRYPTRQAFADAVLTPFARRFSGDDPFRPVQIRGIHADETTGTVVVLWDGRGTTTAGTTYENTYAWIMRLRDGLVVDGTALYDSIAFDELWTGIEPT